MINTLIVIVDLRSTIRGAIFQEFNTDAEQVRGMFSDKIASSRYSVQIFKDLTAKRYFELNSVERLAAMHVWTNAGRPMI